MAQDKHHIIVLRDEEGNTYLLDSSGLKETRVPDDRKAAVEEALQGRDLMGGTLRLRSVASPYKLVGAFSLQHSEGLEIASVLRNL